VRAKKKNLLKVEKLIEMMKGKSSLVIIMQDNPDPDSIASAVALRKFANTLAQIVCSIAHGGTVGRAENRALVQYLDVNLRPANQVDFGKFDLIAMVDTQPGTGNNSLPEDTIPNIVIDHHPLRRATRHSHFFDIRRRYGATSTILLEYLQTANIELDIPLATALLYGIRSDTQDLERQSSRADIKAMEVLFPAANKLMLGEIQRGSVPRNYYLMLDKALKNARVYGNCIVTSLDDVNNPDMIAEVADLLLRSEDIFWTMCTGCFEGKLLISIRTCQQGARADKLIRRIVARRGTGGGHESFAGGQILLKDEAKSRCPKLERVIHQKFIKAVGADIQHWDNLI
jgi:nanoRNase/pAp phosphatase (c-di-AMP/oligoRNAs hydrolase)